MTDDPMAQYHDPIITEGREAYHANIPETDNPYPQIIATSGPTEDWVLWAIGWRWAAMGVTPKTVL
jgi:hypothetical protein